MSRVWVKRTIECCIGIEGDINYIINYLNSIKETYSNYKNIKLEIAQNWGDTTDYNLVGERLETDKEYEKRMRDFELKRKKNNISKLKKEEHDRKEYERLRAKFENKVDTVAD